MGETLKVRCPPDCEDAKPHSHVRYDPRPAVDEAVRRAADAVVDAAADLRADPPERFFIARRASNFRLMTKDALPAVVLGREEAEALAGEEWVNRILAAARTHHGA